MITANQGTTVRLKYLFVVQFDDQTLYEQNPEDVSLIDPEKRSCFYDVMQAVEQGKKIVWFLLLITRMFMPSTWSMVTFK